MTARECTCPLREFLPGEDGRCFKCGGVPANRCRRCIKVLTQSELAGGCCVDCGALVAEP